MKSSTVMLVLAQFASTGAKLVLFVFLMQYGGFEVAGSYTYALSIITPLFLLLGLSLRQIYVTAPSEVNFGHFLFLRLVYGIGGLFLVSLFALLGQSTISALLIVMALFRFVESLIDIRIASFQRESRINLMALSVCLQALLMTGSLALVFILTEELVESVLVGSALGVVLYLVLSKIDSNKTGPTIAPRGEMTKIFKGGLLLSLSSFSVSLGTSVPVLVLGVTHNTAVVGAYSSIYHISSVSNILFSAVTQAELRVLAKLLLIGSYTDFMRRAQRFSTALSAVGALGTIIIYFFGTEIFELIFGQDFSDYQTPLTVMGLTVCLAPFSFFLDAQLTALQRFSSQTVIALSMLVITVLFSFMLIPSFSVFGATLVIFFTMLVRIAIKRIVVSRAIRNIS